MRQASSTQNAPITMPPIVTSAASPQAAVISDQNARQTPMIQTRLRVSAMRAIGSPAVV